MNNNHKGNGLCQFERNCVALTGMIERGLHIVGQCLRSLLLLSCTETGKHRLLAEKQVSAQQKEKLWTVIQHTAQRTPILEAIPRFNHQQEAWRYEDLWVRVGVNLYPRNRDFLGSMSFPSSPNCLIAMHLSTVVCEVWLRWRFEWHPHNVSSTRVYLSGQLQGLQL
jgi:hypothetical protein